jgi:hypothetical protein
MQRFYDAVGPSLPPWCLFPVSALLALGIFYVLLRTRTTAERYLIFACWFRYMLSAFHEYTYKQAFGGLSIIAFCSIGLVGLGFLILDKRRLFIWPFFPVAIICLLMLVSGFVNHNPSGAVEPLVRYAFFVVIAVAFWQAIDTGGPKSITRLLWVFATPVVFQLFSIGLHVAKAGENDGSVSYIGGYYHEQQFSLILASCFVVASLAPQLRRWIRLSISLVSLIGIALANYRTTIVGMTPLVLTQILTGLPAAIRPGQRGFVRSGLLVVGFCGFLAVAAADEQRFGDIGTILTHGTSIIKPPESFTKEDRELLSGRTLLWSTYIYAYDKGTTAQKIVGFGPDSWSGVMGRYAHNTLVSYLYELGVLGVAAILLLWASMAAIALRAPRGIRTKVLAAHASFFLLNMATMPHWQIEGNILYGLICGYTLATARAAQRASRRRPRHLVSQYYVRPEPVSGPAQGPVPAPVR